MRFLMVIVAALCALTSAFEILGHLQAPLMARLAATPMRSDLWLSLYEEQSNISHQQLSSILMMTYVAGGENPKDLGKRLNLLAMRADLNEADVAALAKADIETMLRLGFPFSSAIDAAYSVANASNKIVIIELVESVDAAFATHLREISNASP